jgi:glycosyltransferase involved in cell wall biosynthesis
VSRISVVVPCYNYARYLRECVDSVTGQSHRDIRILIIDDASSDDTAPLAEELARQDARIATRRHRERRGHIETYNEGIAWADGDYWLLLSADDMLLSGALERAAAALDAHPELGLVYGGFVEFRMGRTRPFRAYHRLGRTRATATLAEQGGGSGKLTVWERQGFIAALAEGASVGVSTAVARVAVQRRIGGYRPELPHSGDLEMWVRFALRSQVGFVDSLQAIYREHGSNMSIGYRGYRDLRQRILAFETVRDDIVDCVPGSRPLLHRIERAHAGRAARSAARSLSRGHFGDFRQLCVYALRHAFARSGPQ